MSGNLSRKAAVLLAPLALAVAPVSVNTSPTSVTDIFTANEACADDVAGCKPNPGYVCRIDGIHYWDKEPIIVKSDEAEAQALAN